MNVGTTIPLSTLVPNYDAILFSYGASQDRELGIPGEDLEEVYSARDFVAWYNGLPGCENLDPKLSSSACDGSGNAVVIGQGNVALDVARILLADVDELRKTDTPEPVLERLSKSVVRSVHVVGRRGPSQVSHDSTIDSIPTMLTPFCVIGLLHHQRTPRTSILSNPRPHTHLSLPLPS